MVKKEKSLSQKLSEQAKQPKNVVLASDQAMTGYTFSSREFKFLLISIAFTLIMAATILLMTFAEQLALSLPIQKNIEFFSVLLFPISIYILFQGIAHSIHAAFKKQFQKLIAFSGCIAAALIPWLRVVFDW